MYPGYRFMDSYPHHGNHAPHYGLGSESGSPQMEMENAGNPVNYEPWPYGASHGYPHPVDCRRTCCHYNQYPAYYGYMPPYPHFPPLSPVYGHGGYPSFPVAYPVHNVPSHFSMENPRYEYDKHGPSVHHCCGCPNHFHQQNEGKNVKIVEHDPDDEKTLSSSLVPSQLKNSPYPIVWIPPGYRINKDGTISCVPKATAGEKDGGDIESCKQEPSMWNRWFPIDLNNLRYLNQGGGEGTGVQNKQNEGMSKNSFPIFWMPHKPEQEECKVTNVDKNSEELFYPRVPPMKLIANGDKMSWPKENSDAEAGILGGEDVVHLRNPVDQKEPGDKAVNMKEPSDKETQSKHVAKKDTVIPVEHRNDKPERRPADGSSKTQSSPPKKSKLPPVCLRVDPLPRTKNSNGRPRSPSSLANKEKSQKLLDGSTKAAPSSFPKDNSQENMQSASHLNKKKEGEQSKVKIKTIEVVDGSAIRKEKRQDLKEAQTASLGIPIDCHEKVPMSETDHQAGKADEKPSFEGEKIISDGADGRSSELTEEEKPTVQGPSASVECETKFDGGANNAEEVKADDSRKDAQRKTLSDAEAAVVIQSAYRAFEARRWEPLKKLKEIAKIKEQLTEVKGRVQDLISSYEISSDDKQRVVIGETIMSLLLKLDTIQGFNPTVRDVRKSVAKELVSLQEKLDSLASIKSEASMEKAFKAAEHAEGIPNISHITNDDTCLESEEQIENKELNDNIDDDPDVASDLLPESCQQEPLLETDEYFSSGAAKISEQADICQVPIAQLPEDKDVFNVEPDKIPLPNAKEEDEINSSVKLTTSSSALVTAMTEKDTDLELPQGVLNQEHNDLSADDQTDSGTCMVNHGRPDVERGLLSPGDEPEEMNKDALQQIVLERDGEKEEELVAEAVLGSDQLEIANGEDTKDTNEAPEVYELKAKIGSADDIRVVDNANLRTMEIPVVAQDINEVKPVVVAVDDLGSADDAGLELMEVPVVMPKINEVKEMVGPIDDEIVDNTGQETRGISVVAPDVYEVEAMAGSVDDMGIVDNGGSETMNNVMVATETEKKGSELSLAEDDKSKETLGARNDDEFNWSEFKHVDMSREEERELQMEDALQQNVEQNKEVEYEQVTLEEKAKPKELESIISNIDLVDVPCDAAKEELQLGEAIVPPNVQQRNIGVSSVLSLPCGNVSHQRVIGNDEKLVEENEKLREMMEKLIEAGKEHMAAIATLSGRVKDLEKKLSKKKTKKLRMRRYSKSVSPM